MLKINTDYLKDFVSSDELKRMQPLVTTAHDLLVTKTGAGNDFLGWVDLPQQYDQDEYEKIKVAASNIIADSDVLLVIGIGGSYLGAKAVIDFVGHHFANSLTREQRQFPEIYFVGNNISSTYIAELEDVLSGRDFSLNVISKSGTTTEPALAFRHFKRILVDKYGVEQANKRIYATTDAQNGALKEQATLHGWESFVVPDDIGGRFSVLTAVGLLPIAVSGVDTDQLLAGAQLAASKFTESDLATNDAYLYATYRNILYNKGKDIEILVGYEPSLQYVAEWWKQLFAESEGKDNRGIFPTSAIFSTDLHSIGQMIQSGRRNIFETVITIKDVRQDLTITTESSDDDGLNYLAGATISHVNNQAFRATAIAHTTGDVPNIVLELAQMDAKSIGYLIYFFEKAVAISGYLLGVNPFDQPGVEEYKKNMFALLGKSGFAELREQLERK